MPLFVLIGIFVISAFLSTSLIYSELSFIQTARAEVECNDSLIRICGICVNSTIMAQHVEQTCSN